MEKEEIRLKWATRAAGYFYVPAQAKVYFVTRIPEGGSLIIGLMQINNAAFVKVTKATKQMVRLVEAYVAEPNLKPVRQSIYKRGCDKINKQRIPLTNNAVIEESLGEFGIFSVEGLVHKIYIAAPTFKKVPIPSYASNFPWQFKLSNPTGGWRTRKFKKFKQLVEDGGFGNCEENIT
ncbi:ribosomal protein L30p/L7e [Laetiporus sulphureus 93-53]|uniref:Ribosomal protein L30p/L7e n=1 Tax=Laetiporus sulphureus 93-53 TaxID=1314785 RepID=A0A165APB7_9APHY|nr:ribosomal protein L30p/L7e [Laetiporus sulphureus 93-53]KZS99395.1 ribosomal protein L30p/L7e [Laetiporus sulphureus 93-53]